MEYLVSFLLVVAGLFVFFGTTSLIISHVTDSEFDEAVLITAVGGIFLILLTLLIHNVVFG